MVKAEYYNLACAEIDMLKTERDRLRAELDTANALLGKTGYMCPVCNNPVSSADKGCVYCELKKEHKMRLQQLDEYDAERRAVACEVDHLRTQLEEAKKEREQLQKVVDAAKSQFAPCIIYCSDCCSKKLCTALRNLETKTSSCRQGNDNGLNTAA